MEDYGRVWTVCVRFWWAVEGVKGVVGVWRGVNSCGGS